MHKKKEDDPERSSSFKYRVLKRTRTDKSNHNDLRVAVRRILAVETVGDLDLFRGLDRDARGARKRAQTEEAVSHRNRITDIGHEVAVAIACSEARERVTTANQRVDEVDRIGEVDVTVVVRIARRERRFLDNTFLCGGQ